jgi:hypothetical protein
MLHKRIGATLVTIAAVAACSRPRVETAGGEISTPATPANARILPLGAQLDVLLNQQLGTQSSLSGDLFSANVTNAVIAQNGRTTVPAGAGVWGHVTAVTPATNAETEILGRSGESGMLPIGSHLSLQTTQAIALR